MTKPFKTFAAALLLLSAGVQVALSAPSLERVRTTKSFDADWRFLKSDALGAEQPTFADASWRSLNVPHDWSIEGPFDKSNPIGGAGAFLPGGVGWYRKSFTLPQSSRRNRVFIEFDGVMANSEVWINGFLLGKRPYGYVSFRYELTEHLNYGGRPNVLAVRADNSVQLASRWYTGAGIYRHVRLVTTNPVHLEQWSTFVSTPQATAQNAMVRVQSRIVNQSATPRRVALQVVLLDPQNKVVARQQTSAQNLAAGQTGRFQQDLSLQNPHLWDITTPSMYHVVARVREGQRTLDDEAIPAGVREFHFEPATGFWLNGRNLKIKGVCLHHDASSFGAAVPLRAWERRLATLRQIGVNAIRTAHNPPAPEFLDLCDRMGFLVMDELFDTWRYAKNPGDYHLYFNEWANADVRDTVLRDRNHPSIILYSTGNEIRDTPNAELAKGILTSLVATFHENDPTRPVTQALFRPNVSHDYENGLADLLDVVGQNYREKEILAAHEQKPSRKIIGTENGHDRNAWLSLRDNPSYSGQFLWTGVDYLGETRQWPFVAGVFGLLDRTGTPRPLAFQRQSWWSDRPMVYVARRVAPSRPTPTDPGYEPTVTERQPQVLFGDWTPANKEPHQENVEVYSNCQNVELFLNGQSLGSKPRPRDDSSRNWTVPFASGVLRAVTTNNNVVVATQELRTAGVPTRVVLQPDRSRLTLSWDDVCYVKAVVVDDNGVVVPTAADLITFTVSGSGTIAGVDSANNASHEPFLATQRSAYQGSCFATVKATKPKGTITLTASAPGLQSTSIRLPVGS